MNRRQALKTLALSAGALTALPAWRAGEASAQTPPATPGGPPGRPADAAGPFTLPALPYPFDALEPHIDAQTMQIHHDRHHAAYVANLNKALAGHADLGAKPVEDLLRGLDALPQALKTAVRNQGGGHANHSLFWVSLKKGGPAKPTGELAAAIDKRFTSFTSFWDQFAQAGLSVFGSGWAWLSLDTGGQLGIETTPNQDSPLMQGRKPLLGLDVWEHAYYLKYQNRRADYVAAFANVVDWDAVSERYRKVR
jgi:Fe-Mn family superoxide dismutase